MLVSASKPCGRKEHLQHEPHGDHVITGMTPVAFCVEIAQLNVPANAWVLMRNAVRIMSNALLLLHGYGCDRARDLAGHKRSSASRTFVIE